MTPDGQSCLRPGLDKWLRRATECSMEFKGLSQEPLRQPRKPPGSPCPAWAADGPEASRVEAGCLRATHRPSPRIARPARGISPAAAAQPQPPALPPHRLPPRRRAAAIIAAAVGRPAAAEENRVLHRSPAGSSSARALKRKPLVGELDANCEDATSSSSDDEAKNSQPLSGGARRGQLPPSPASSSTSSSSTSVSCTSSSPTFVSAVRHRVAAADFAPGRPLARRSCLKGANLPLKEHGRRICWRSPESIVIPVSPRLTVTSLRQSADLREVDVLLAALNLDVEVDDAAELEEPRWAHERKALPHESRDKDGDEELEEGEIHEGKEEGELTASEEDSIGEPTTLWAPRKPSPDEPLCSTWRRPFASRRGASAGA